MIKLSTVSKSFISGKSRVHALEDINLEIKQGEFVALVGPSGSGKSTLLNMIGGLDIPTKGKVLINKKAISNLSDQELSKYRNHEIGFVFQEFHLESFLSVKNNVLLPTFFNHKTKKDEQYADHLIDEVGLSAKAESKVNELSGGQKQRTAIARALINKPSMILADEPTGNLDIKTGKSIIDLLKKLHKVHNVTLIIATHDNAIAKIADKVVHIKDGKITK